jgi:hypothetical protein
MLRQRYVLRTDFDLDALEPIDADDYWMGAGMGKSAPQPAAKFKLGAYRPCRKKSSRRWSSPYLNLVIPS